MLSPDWRFVASGVGHEPGGSGNRLRLRRSSHHGSLIKTTGLALFAMILSVSARAQNVEVGSGIYCDSQKQVERFVALFHGDAEATINTVNAEMKNPTACIAATIAFIRGPEVASPGPGTRRFTSFRSS